MAAGAPILFERVKMTHASAASSLELRDRRRQSSRKLRWTGRKDRDTAVRWPSGERSLAGAAKFTRCVPSTLPPFGPCRR